MADIKIKIDFDANTKELTLTQEELKKLSRGLKDSHDKAVQSSAGFDNMKSKLLGLAAGVGILYTLKEAFEKVVHTGIEYNDQLETMKIGISSLIAVNASNTTSLGRNITALEKYQMATTTSAQVMQELKLANLETSATLAQLTQAFQAALAPSLKAGMNLKQTVEYTKLMTQAAGAMGVPMEQLSQELKSVVSGTIDLNSVVAMNLGITNDQIKKAKEQGELYEFLRSKLQDFAIAGADVSNSFSGSVSNMEDAFSTFAAEISEPVFDTLKEGAKKATELFNDLTKSIIEMKLEAKDIRDIREYEEYFEKMASLQKEWDELENSKKNPDWYNPTTWSVEALTAQQKMIEGEISLLRERYQWIDKTKALSGEKLSFDIQANVTETKSKTSTKKPQSYDAHIRAYENYKLQEYHKSTEINQKISDDYARMNLDQYDNQKYTLAMKYTQEVQYADDVSMLNEVFVQKMESIDQKRLEDLKKLTKEGKDLATQLGDSFEENFSNRFADALLDGKASFSDFANSILSDMARIAINNSMQPIAQAGGSFLTDLFSNIFPNAHGGMYSSPSLSQYSNQIFDTPTFFAFANGGVPGTNLGVFGEAGTEAIMPVTKVGADLGVKAMPSNVVIMIENHGQDLDLKQLSDTTRTNERGEQERVLRFVSDGVNRNINGIRDQIKGLR